MILSLDEFNEIKAKVANLQAEAARAEGALQQTQQRLKDEFGVETVDESEKLLEKLQAKADKATKKYEAKLAAFEEKWGEALDA